MVYKKNHVRISDYGQKRFFMAIRTLASDTPGVLSRLGLRKRLRSFSAFIQKRPFVSFFVTLGLLLLFIVLGSLIGRPSSVTDGQKITPKQVEIYSIGESPTITVQAKVEKGSVIRINAQMSGIVSVINVKEGDTIKRGANLLQLSSTYDGANQAAIQAQIAQKQYNLASQTYPIQSDIIKKQRQIAQKTETNTEELRKISEKSLLDTKDLLSQNNEILTLLDQNLQTLLQNNTGTPEDQQAILQARQLKTQYQSSVAMLNNQARTLEYQTNRDNPPTALSEIQKELTLRQLDIQEKSQAILLEIAKLQLHLAFIATSLMHPTSPVEGIVESVLVSPLQQVNPGTPLFVISGKVGTTKVRADVSRSIAERISQADTSVLLIDNRKYEVRPYYVSTEATSSNLYSIYYILSGGNDVAVAVADGEYVSVTIPVGSAQTGATIPFIPLDAIYQTQDSSFVYVVNGDQAKARKVKLGNVFGSYVVVEEGLGANDKLILDRTIVDGDQISARL